jgi:spermidine synthase
MPKQEAIIMVVFDGININVSHFAKMDKKTAVEAMKADGILSTHGKSVKWAETIYNKCKDLMFPEDTTDKN